MPRKKTRSQVVKKLPLFQPLKSLGWDAKLDATLDNKKYEDVGIEIVSPPIVPTIPAQQMVAK